MRVRFPHGVLTSERSEAWLSRLAGGQETVCSNPTVLTDNRAEVQMAARLLWEQEGFGSTPKRPTFLARAAGLRWGAVSGGTQQANVADMKR